MRIIRTTCACVKKDFICLLSYSWPVILKFMGVLGILGVLYFLPVFIRARWSIPSGFESNYQETLSFLVSGVMFSMYFLSVLTIFARRMQDERRMGTIEALLVTPSRFVWLVLSMYIASFLISFLYNIPLALFGFYYLKMNASIPNIPATVLVFLLSIVLFGAISLFIAAFIILFERGENFAFFLRNVFRIFGNVYFSVYALPKTLQIISYSLPITYCVTAFRKSLFGRTLGSVMDDVWVILLFTLLLWTTGIPFLLYSLKRVKIKGTLSYY